MASAKIFRDISKGGSSASLSLPTGDRYATKKFADLTSFGPIPAISSMELTPDTDAETSIYLFSGLSSIGWNDYRRIVPYNTIRTLGLTSPWMDFHGQFVRVTLPGGAAPFSIQDLSKYATHEKTGNFKLASSLLVRRSKDGVFEETISGQSLISFFWDLFLGNTTVPGLIPLIQLLKPGLAIGKMGQALFTWLPFPERPKFRSKDVHLMVSQQFLFHASGFGVNAWLMLYFRFSVRNHRLFMEVVDMDRYVWPAFGGEELRMALDDAKGQIISGLNLVLAFIMKLIPSNCDDVYLLPGTHPTTRPTEEEIAVDDTLNDVTIILVNAKEGKPDFLTGPSTRSDSAPLAADMREVTSVRRTSKGVTTHLGGPQGSAWSPVTVAAAIKEVRSGVACYFTRAGERIAMLEIRKTKTGQSYLRAAKDGLPENNLDKLPLIGA